LNNNDKEVNPNQIEGKNAVLEALKAGRTVDKVLLADGNTDRVLGEIGRKAKTLGAVLTYVDRRKLDELSVTGVHQGVIAFAAEISYAEISDMLTLAKERGEDALIVICDEISDPHNLGAIIRSAECAGAHGVVIPKRHSAGLSSAVVGKASAGAINYVPIARVPNLNAALRELKDAGVWICGADGDANQLLWSANLTLPLAIVIGAEGEGLSRLIKENCDFLAAVPMKGQVGSLNASNAAAVMLFEVARQRVSK
jgi:23S rRNA (guanosine2251-2'-O)-methyltransferase